MSCSLKNKTKITVSVFLLLFFTFTMNAFAADPSKVVSKVNTSAKQIALTFDDGSDGGNITSILQTLSDNNIKSTFFITGTAASAHPDLIKKIVQQGNELGNHSYTHPYFTKLTASQIKSELTTTDSKITSITGKSTKPLFRPPFGDYNSQVLQAVGDAGYSKTITWTIDTLDWKGVSADEITQKVLNNASPGTIVLMHTGVEATGTPKALPNIIKGLKAKGYEFVTVSKLLSNSSSTQLQYVVKSGDTLYKIATLFGVTVQSIMTANNITNANLIYVNQVLIIPGITLVQYVVKSGDTLTKIANSYNVSVQSIMTVNNITNANLIYVNQVLSIPAKAPRQYVVKSGDTLTKIAALFGVTVQSIMTTNNITNPDLIYVNQVLIIP